jgi:hypothetical protein
MVEQYGLKRAEKLSNSLPFMFRDYPDFPASTLSRVEENVSNLAAKVLILHFGSASKMH